MKINAEFVRQHVASNEAIETALKPLAREIHIAQRKAEGGEPYSTVMEGSLDKWEAEDGQNLTVTFYITGRYSYQDWHSVYFPLAWLDDDSWRAQLAQQALDFEAAAKVKAEAAAQAAETKERARLAELKEKYPDA